MSLSATVNEPTFLVVNEAWFPGVVATDNGVSVPVHPANHAVRAVHLGPGHHEVKMSYRTPGLWAGALISLASLLGIVAWLVRARVMRRAVE
ncbi:MAG: hypothetical protein ACKVPX_07060 [Myxococcaceae bacterium]